MTFRKQPLGDDVPPGAADPETSDVHQGFDGPHCSMMRLLRDPADSSTYDEAGAERILKVYGERLFKKAYHSEQRLFDIEAQEPRRKNHPLWSKWTHQLTQVRINTRIAISQALGFLEIASDSGAEDLVAEFSPYPLRWTDIYESFLQERQDARSLRKQSESEEYEGNHVTGRGSHTTPDSASREVISVPEFAHLIGTGEKRVRRYISQGKIRILNHGRKVMIPRNEVGRFLDRESKFLKPIRQD